MNERGAAGGAFEPAIVPRPAVHPLPPVDLGRSGRFITFEGIEGSGKSTQIQRLADRLSGLGEAVLVTREPGGSRLGQRLRGILLDHRGAAPSAEAEMFLYVADRVQHLVDVVEPALRRGDNVLCDRYVDATLAYQGFGRGLDLDWIRALHRRPPLDRRPVRTFLLDLDPETGLGRARNRNADLGLAAVEGRFEAESLEFHRRVREGYLRLAEDEPFRFRIVAADGPPEAVEARICDLLTDLYPGLDTDES